MQATQAEVETPARLRFSRATSRASAQAIRGTAGPIRI
jgi:hypothetical protein